MKISLTNQIAAAAALGLITAACGGSTPAAESPASDEAAPDMGDAAGDPNAKGEGCKGEEGCEHKGECKGEEKCKGGEECKGKESCEGHTPE